MLLETADLFAWTIVVMVASAVCERLFVALLDESARWCCRWAAPVTWADPEEQVYEPGVAGFGSVGTFNRIFRQRKHCTPTQFRTIYGKTPSVFRQHLQALSPQEEE